MDFFLLLLLFFASQSLTFFPFFFSQFMFSFFSPVSSPQRKINERQRRGEGRTFFFSPSYLLRLKVRQKYKRKQINENNEYSTNTSVVLKARK